MKVGKQRVRANWGHLAFVTGLLGLCLAYLYDTASVSTDIENLLLVLPATVLAAALYLVIVVHEIEFVPASTNLIRRRGFELPQLRTPALMVLVGAYLLAIAYTGFDISTAIFIAASLAVQGERRILVLFGYSVAFAVLVVLGMRALLPFPVPTTLL